ncbi:putative autotransporter [Yersinia frederiksenii]|uniref:autotransporter outer membrane beta-barrel domain-containing protein n=1 Tax=Yersinia frederiksenii TaxID=29484 RepID=UPI0005E62628|nr:autotransporter outer membrane beta-barrel domain-containing protein [Yersinia frederiksenii]CND18688.1 putative autotransporter [Yersinia frederiksenii]
MKIHFIYRTTAVLLMFIFNSGANSATHGFSNENNKHFDFTNNSYFPSTDSAFFSSNNSNSIYLDNISIINNDTPHSNFGDLSLSTVTLNNLNYSGTGKVDRFFQMVISKVTLSNSYIETNATTVFFGGNQPSASIINSSINNTNANGSMFTSPYSDYNGDKAFTFSVDNSQLTSQGVLVDGLIRDMTLDVSNGSVITSNSLANSDKFIAKGYLTINLKDSILQSGITQDSGSKVTLNIMNGSVFSLTGDTINSQIQEVNLTDNSSLNFINNGQDYKNLKINKITSDNHTNTIWMGTDLSQLKGDFLDIGQASGKFTLNIKDSGKEAIGKVLDVAHVAQGEEGQFTLASGASGIDAGTYVYYLNSTNNNDEYIWSLNMDKETSVSTDPTAPTTDPTVPPTAPTVPITKPVTTPSVDAILSIAASQQFIFDGELQNLRYRKGNFRYDKSNTGGVWARYLTNNSRITAAENTSQFRLLQNGIEIGSDKTVNFSSSDLVVGLFTGYSNNQIKHERGGKSNVDSYSLGGYATYLGHNGYYLDGTLKVNSFSNDIRALSTQGDSISGDYNQISYGGALESGYQFHMKDIMYIEPYVRTTYFNAGNKQIELSNGMKADIGNSHSVRGEIGTVVGKEWALDNSMVISPYFKFAIEREFIKSNKVRINDTNTLHNDFSGNTGKYGAGVDVQLTKQSNLYAEANYRQGERVESPIMANIGFRINF